MVNQNIEQCGEFGVVFSDVLVKNEGRAQSLSQAGD